MCKAYSYFETGMLYGIVFLNSQILSMVAVQEVEGGGSGRLDCGSCQTRIIILGLMAPVPLHCSNLLCYVSQVFAAGMCVFGSCIRNPLYCTLHVTVNPIISLSPNNQNQPTASSNTHVSYHAGGIPIIPRKEFHWKKRSVMYRAQELERNG